MDKIKVRRHEATARALDILADNLDRLANQAKAKADESADDYGRTTYLNRYHGLTTAYYVTKAHAGAYRGGN